MSLTERDKKWLKERKEAGERIDPNSADVEVTILGAEVTDPYGVHNPPNACFGRSYFVRSPDSGGWVSFDDLPVQTYEELWRRLRAGEFDDSFKRSWEQAQADDDFEMPF